MNPFGFIVRKIESLRFRWYRRRYLWRASYFYSVLSWALVIGIILTFTFHYLLTNFKFFMSYCCSSRSIRMITWYIAIEMFMTGIILMMAIFLARVCNMFSNYIISESMSTGRMMTLLGCSVKWMPWFLSFVFLLTILIHTGSLIWIFVNSQQWCANRYNDAVVNAVKNCRAIIKGSIPCQMSFKSGLHKEIRECNSPTYLLNKRLMLVALANKKSSLPCSIEDPAVCTAFNDSLLGKAVDWTKPELKGCLGKLPKTLDDYIDTRSLSDLYKYLLLYDITWAVVYFLMICFFYLMKHTTEFDAIIYQPFHQSENILIKIMRPMTPWS
ncbi:hypothetical protein BgAZ_501180 [Babesia gibsoni]|uniref:Uncharacterized protein n=1 Tax=Babesia gibsoni TaxID=33632 RepID=A0AAD8LMD0_BABGI|nr:hypothetical protein BgAZ_501180 [Babesia gibsoni]